MNGLKMRVAGSQLLNRSYELWVADYTNANWSEVFTALQTGTLRRPGEPPAHRPMPLPSRRSRAI